MHGKQYIVQHNAAYPPRAAGMLGSTFHLSVGAW